MMASRYHLALFASLLFLPGAAAAASPVPGADLFKRCASCHLPSGKGISGIYPPLTDRLGPLTANAAGREYLVNAISAGLIGPINVGGIIYRGAMPPQAGGLNDEKLAAVLNYMLVTFNAKSLPRAWKKFTAGEVASVRKKHAGIKARDVVTLRPKALSGAGR